MGAYDWWKRTFAPQKKEKKIDTIHEIEAIIDFLEDVHVDVKKLLPLFEKLLELEKERSVSKASLIPINLETQGEVLNKILTSYSAFEDDTDVNGLRLKRIAQAFLHHAAQEGLSDLVKEKKKDMKWHFV